MKIKTNGDGRATTTRSVYLEGRIIKIDSRGFFSEVEMIQDDICIGSFPDWYVAWNNPTAWIELDIPDSGKVFELLSSVSKEILHIQNINTATWDNRYVENFAAKAQSDLADAVRLISEDKNETM